MQVLETGFNYTSCPKNEIPPITLTLAFAVCFSNLSSPFVTRNSTKYMYIF